MGSYTLTGFSSHHLGSASDIKCISIGENLLSNYCYKASYCLQSHQYQQIIFRVVHAATTFDLYSVAIVTT